MNKIIHIDNKYVEAAYIVDYKMAHVIWKNKIISSETYRNAITAMLEYGVENETVNFLSDGTLGGPNSPSDRKWFQEYAVPFAEKHGLKHAAVIIANDPFKKYYMNAILRVVNRNASYNMKIFNSYEVALKWLIDHNDH